MGGNRFSMLEEDRMELKRYFERVGFRGTAKPDRATLNRLMKAHVLSVTFENLDVQLGVPVSTSPTDAYCKIVDRHRGGWCFEQNALFRWALREIGFQVASLAGYVGRVDAAPPRPASHLFLKVDLNEPLFVDVSFGGSLLKPMPLSPGRVEQVPYELSINPTEDGYFRWSETAHGETSSLDFTLQPVADDYFDEASHSLQTSADSPFVRTLTAQRRYEDRHVILRGLVKRTISRQGFKEVIIPSSEALVNCLRDDFRLDVPQIETCWDKIKARHMQVMAERAAN